jgi:anti-sigma B factor antagonist
MKTELSSVNNNVQILKLTGRLAGAEVRNIQKILTDHLKTSNNLIVDCSELEYMDSSGLGALIFGLKSAMARGGDLRLATILAKVKMMLEITRADKIFKIYPTVDEAVASFETTITTSEGV